MGVDRELVWNAIGTLQIRILLSLWMHRYDKPVACYSFEPTPPRLGHSIRRASEILGGSDTKHCIVRPPWMSVANSSS